MGSHQEKSVSAGAAGVVAVAEVSDGLVKVGKTSCSYGLVWQREGILGLVPDGRVDPCHQVF